MEAAAASPFRSVAAALGVLALALAQPVAGIFDNSTVIAPCDSVLYCHGEILKQIELAAPFSDSKTFVDMPTIRPLDEVVAAFDELTKPLSNNTELLDFLDTYFASAGGELETVSEDELVINATFLDKINDTVISEFVSKVIDIWPDLTRKYNGGTDGTNCTGCQSSFVPVNRTFVVAGGRFREPYYWDSYWIIEGLLRTGGSFIDISRNTIENFLDLIETYGFVPNGARVYYLNRSQPPLLSQMVRLYIEYTGDDTILDRALPLLIKEHEFWTTNRSVSVTGPDSSNYTLSRYAVLNNQPRPESYFEDYVAANNASYYASSGEIYPDDNPLNDTEKADLYSEFASGAESGWDYGTRWLARPNDAVRDDFFPLRSLNIKNILPVDLNAILYWNEIVIGDFLNVTGNTSEAAEWKDAAKQRSEAMYALMWNETLWSYFDYNISSQAQNIYIPVDSDATAADNETASSGTQVLFNVAQFYPFWTGAAPEALKNDPLAVKMAYARVQTLLDTKEGGISATNLATGQQWDEPNVWPPLQHILMQGLLNTPATFGTDDSNYQYLQTLALELGQRYLDSTFCTWYATGGSTSLTPQLAGFSVSATGTIFEKYADNSTNGAGSGGEYTVVEGFGWSNGVILWTADTFGNQLTRPDCGNITAADVTPGKRRRSSEWQRSARPRPPSAVQLDAFDASRTKMFGRKDNMHA